MYVYIPGKVESSDSDESKSGSLSSNWVVEVSNEKISIPEGAIVSSGIVSDSSKSITEMKDISDLIIKGKVVGQKPFSGIITLSTVDVVEQWKGKSTHSSVVIHQFSNETLELNKEYVLFLGKQEDDKQNTYYIKGGHQGNLLSEKGNISSRNTIIADELASLEAERSLTSEGVTIEAMLKSMVTE